MIRRISTITQIVLATTLISGCKKENPAIVIKSHVGAETQGAAKVAERTAVPTKDEALPILFATKLRPMADVADFRDVGYFKYVKESVARVPKDEAFTNDDDAIAAARKWVILHFGDLPAESSLEFEGLEHTTSDHSKPHSDWDRGHITFRQLYRGVPTTGCAIVYFTGRSMTMASVTLYAFAPIPGTARLIVTERAAINAMRSAFAQSDGIPPATEALSERAEARLFYLWSLKENETFGRDEADVLAPNWIMGGDQRLAVDAYTGKAWDND